MLFEKVSTMISMIKFVYFDYLRNQIIRKYFFYNLKKYFVYYKKNKDALIRSISVKMG